MIREMWEKIKDVLWLIGGDLWLVLVIFLVSFASFGLGRLSVLYAPQGHLEVVYPPAVEGSAGEGEVLGAEVQVMGQYVASRTGSKYHFPWCAGAQSIKEENKIWFDSKEEAEAAGYAPAANCKGL